MRLTAVRNRVSAAAAEPRVPAPKTRQSIRLDEGPNSDKRILNKEFPNY